MEGVHETKFWTKNPFFSKVNRFLYSLRCIILQRRNHEHLKCWKLLGKDSRRRRKTKIQICPNGISFYESYVVLRKKITTSNNLFTKSIAATKIEIMISGFQDFKAFISHLELTLPWSVPNRSTKSGTLQTDFRRLPIKSTCN